MKRVCLVLEGGGNRGTYTAGVLDAFLDNKIYIPNIYSVSAGALNSLSYLSRQRGRSFRINKEYALSKKCVDYKRILRLQSVLNLDFLFNEVNDEIDPFDVEAFDNNKENFVVTCTNIVTGAPVYKNITYFKRDRDYIKASASLPLFSKVVEIDNMKLLDGGMSDSIPVIKALEDNYDKVIVVLTRDKSFKCKPYKLMNAYKTKYFRYPNLIKSMENRFNKYNVTRDLIDALEQEGKILAIYPSEPLIINSLEKSGDKLTNIYNIGYQDATNMISKIQKYIGGKKIEE